MDTELLVDNRRIEEGQKVITELVHDGFDVAIAFWVLSSEDHVWSLYLGSASITPEKIGDAYRQLYACLSRIPDASVSFSDVKLIQASDLIARDAMAVRDRHPGVAPIKYEGKRLGNLFIEMAYIYPATSGPMTPMQILQTVFARTDRSSGPLRPSRITFQDGSAISAIITGFNLQLPGSLEITILDPATNKSRQISGADVVNIQ